MDHPDIGNDATANAVPTGNLVKGYDVQVFRSFNPQESGKRLYAPTLLGCTSCCSRPGTAVKVSEQGAGWQLGTPLTHCYIVTKLHDPNN